MNVVPILIMASAVFVFAVTALSIATVLGVGISQVRGLLGRKSRT